MQDGTQSTGGDGEAVEPGKVLDSIAESAPAQRAGEMIDSATQGWPAWAQLLALLVGFVAVCVGLRYALVVVMRRVLDKSEHLSQWKPVLDQCGRATLAVAVALGVALGLMTSSGRSLIPGASSAMWDELAAFAFVLSVTWLVVSVISGATGAYLARYELEHTDNTQAQRVQTQMRVLSRASMVVVWVVGLAAGLLMFESVERIGASMLASAGVMGIIVGFAARQVLGNLLAGVQIALTQPLRLGDTVVIGGHYGVVEEISMAFVSVRLWNERRLIVPLEDVISDAFENLTRTSSETLGPVILQLDFDTPVGVIREKLGEILDGNDLHDGRVAKVQVIDSGEKTMEVRILASAANAADAWALHCDVREKMYAFLVSEHPEALPIEREQTLDADRTPIDPKSGSGGASDGSGEGSPEGSPDAERDG